MKILQVIPTLNIGGAETMLCNLACELADADHEVVVVTFYSCNTSITDRLNKNGIRIISIDKKSGFDVNVLIKLRRIIRSEKPDVIHTHLHVLPYVYMVSGNVKIVHTLHSIASKEQSGFGKRFCGFIYKNSSKCVPVAVSGMVKSTFEEEYNVNYDIPVVDNGVPIDNIRQKNSYELKDTVEIYHVGRIEPVKNHALMINSVERLLPDYPVRLHFFGDGSDRELLSAQVAANGLQNSVVFEGNSSTLWNDLQRADIFILPSQYEGMPMSLIEAMAAGLPSIASRVGGVPNVVEDGVNGILIDPTEDDLCNAIARLVDDDALRTSVGRNAVNRATAFSSRKMMESYIDVYKYKKIRSRKK